MKINTNLYNPDIKQKLEINKGEVFQLTINKLIESYKDTGKFKNEKDLKLTVEEFVLTNFTDNLPDEFADDDYYKFILIEEIIFDLLIQS